MTKDPRTPTTTPGVRRLAPWPADGPIPPHPMVEERTAPPVVGCSTCGDVCPALPTTPIRVEAARPDPLAEWPAFAAMVRARLEAGRESYGDRSFSRDPAALIVEIEEELADVIGWAYPLWRRLENMRKALKRAETEARRKGVEGAGEQTGPALAAKRGGR